MEDDFETPRELEHTPNRRKGQERKRLSSSSEHLNIKRDTLNGRSHMIARVKRGKFEQFFLRANVKLCRFCPAWIRTVPTTS